MFDIDYDDRAATHRLRGMARRLGTPHEMLDLLVDNVHEYEQDVFDSSGNGQWPSLSAKTVSLKGSSRILVDDGDLLAALTTNADIMGDAAAVTADDVAHARFHKTGTSRMPRRDPSPDPPAHLVDEWAHDLLEHVVGDHR